MSATRSYWLFADEYSADELTEMLGAVGAETVAEQAARQVIRDRVGAEDGRPFPSHSWPGCYPIGYLTDDGEWLCGQCVSSDELASSVHFSGDADGWRVDAADIIEDNERDEHCVHCGRLIAEGNGS